MIIWLQVRKVKYLHYLSSQHDFFIKHLGRKLESISPGILNSRSHFLRLPLSWPGGGFVPAKLFSHRGESEGPQPCRLPAIKMMPCVIRTSGCATPCPPGWVGFVRTIFLMIYERVRLWAQGRMKMRHQDGNGLSDLKLSAAQSDVERKWGFDGELNRRRNYGRLSFS